MPFLYSESQIKLYPNSPCVLSFHPWYYLASLHQRLDICLTMRSAGEIIIIMTVAICLCERICFLIFKISFELFPFLCDYLRYCIFSSDMCQDLSLQIIFLVDNTFSDSKQTNLGSLKNIYLFSSQFCFSTPPCLACLALAIPDFIKFGVFTDFS